MSVFVIAEIGINHNGDIDIAKKLIDVAVFAKCDAVKFQKRTPNICVPEQQKCIRRETPWGEISYIDYRHHVEFGLDEYKEIDRYCKSKNMTWFASAWDLDSLEFLQQFDLRYNKIASAMTAYIPLLEKVASEKKYTFISTGMSNLPEIEKAVEIFRQMECPFEIMHGVSTYPMNTEDANLKNIVMLRDKFCCNIGYSGHEPGLAVSYAAIALGATSIERHITLDRSMWGTDQAASLESRGLYDLVGAVRKIEKALGNKKRTITKEVEKKKKTLRWYE